MTSAQEYTLTAHVKDILKLEQSKTQLEETLGRDATLSEWAVACEAENFSAFVDDVKLGLAAKRQMMKCNERLVYHVARKYTNRGLDFPDLTSEGMSGLMKGVEKFDHTKGFKFSTYAHWWIRQAIGRAIMDYGRAVRSALQICCSSTCSSMRAFRGHRKAPDMTCPSKAHA